MRSVILCLAAVLMPGLLPALAQNAQPRPTPPVEAPAATPPSGRAPADPAVEKAEDVATAAKPSPATAPAGRYAAGDVRGALTAWNAINQPLTDRVTVYGVRRTDPGLVARFAGLQPGALLTTSAFLRAQRRLDQLPLTSIVKYAPMPDGRARVELDVEEPTVLPTGFMPIMTILADGLITRQFELEASSPTGRGELVKAAWRWQQHWTRYTLGADVPITGPLPGVVSIAGRWEHRLFEPAQDFSETHERRTLGAGFSTWATDSLWWHAGVAADHFSEGTYGSLDGAVEQRMLNDLAAINVEGAEWRRAGLPTFGRVSGALSLRSTTRTDRPLWLAVTGAAGVSAQSPLQTWVGAGTGSVAYAPLRAHPLVRDGILNGQAFGRRLAFGSLEYNRPLLHSPAGPVAWAAFVDTARSWRRAAGLADTPWLVDVGLGLRLRADAIAGVVSVDVASDVRTGRLYTSVNLVPRWPSR
jgi:hypothetical protein